MAKKHALKPHLRKSIKESLLKDQAFQLPELIAISSDVLLLVFSSRHSMSLSLKRAHEAYEGGALKGPLKGINFPWDHYQQWIQNVSDATREELALFQHIQQQQTPTESCTDPTLTASSSSICTASTQYLMACLSHDTGTLLHEWAHAMYHLNSEYRQLCQDIYNQNHPLHRLSAPCRQAIEKEFMLRHYKPSVFCDEFQAYVVESANEFGKKWIKDLYECHLILRKSLPPLPPLDECRSQEFVKRCQ